MPAHDLLGFRHPPAPYSPHARSPSPGSTKRYPHSRADGRSPGRRGDSTSECSSRERRAPEPKMQERGGERIVRDPCATFPRMFAVAGATTMRSAPRVARMCSIDEWVACPGRADRDPAPGAGGPASPEPPSAFAVSGPAPAGEARNRSTVTGRSVRVANVSGCTNSVADLVRMHSTPTPAFVKRRTTSAAL